MTRNELEKAPLGELYYQLDCAELHNDDAHYKSVLAEIDRRKAHASNRPFQNG